MPLFSPGARRHPNLRLSKLTEKMHAHPRRLFSAASLLYDLQIYNAAIPEQFNTKSLFGMPQNLAFTFYLFSIQER